MKVFKNIFLGSAVALSLSMLASSCSEEATLDGADAVYIEMTPTDFTLALRDTVAISARVTNVSGDVIDTPISWSVDDPNLVKIIGDTAVTCINGAQGRSTKLRATLANNQYAVTNVTIVHSNAKGVIALTPRKHSYYEIPNDTVWFEVNPAKVLEESTPIFEYELVKLNNVAEGASSEFAFSDNPVYVEKDEENRPTGKVGVVFTAPRISGSAIITLRVGEENPMEDKAEIIVYPTLNLSFYSDRENLPSPSSPGTFSTSIMMDVNSVANIGVSVGVAGMRDEDIKNAYDCYEWKVEGTCVVPVEENTEYVETHGYLANLKVHSGLNEGTCRVMFITPDTVLIANVTVDNYVKNHPVDEIVTDKEELLVVAGRTSLLNVDVRPSSSYEFHVPKVVSADPTIAAVQERGTDDGTTVTIRGIKPGKTTLTITALDKTKTIPVEVTDEVAVINWGQSNPNSVSVGESVEMNVSVQMSSGAPCTQTVTWTSSDPSIATIQPKSGDTTKAVITGVKEGTVTIVAECGGKKTTAREVRVTSNADRVLSGNGSIDDNGDGTLFLHVDDAGEAIDVIVPWCGHSKNNIVGTYAGVGDDTCVAYIGDSESGVGEYNFTIAENGGYVLNGYVTTSSGVKIRYNNVKLTIE